ncbi:MAG: S9 family peptidase [Acidimicrobiales bacterium]|nr:S9 family peptidase [Acidimicrobiales bacterium]
MTADTDELAWLEEIEGANALEWVRARNAETESDLFSSPLFAELRAGALGVLEADDRIPMPHRHGEKTVLNFWTDATNRRGVLRRMTWDRYRAEDQNWEIVLDVDALGRDEGESWVVQGFDTRRPDHRRTLVDLSPGGSDASVTREFDLVDKRFIPAEEGGFVRPLAKGWLAWIDDDTVYVGNDFGPGSLTTSGYPRTVRRWSRGTPLEDAPLVFEGEPDDVWVEASVSTLPGFKHHLFRRSLDFFRSRKWILRDGVPFEIDVPEDAVVDVRERFLLVHPRTDWTMGDATFPGGSLLAADLAAYLDGARTLDVLFRPTPTSALAGWTWTRHHLVLSIQEDVRDRLEVLTPGEGWARRPLRGAPPLWSVGASSVDRDENDELWLTGNDFVTPATLYFGSVDQAPEVLRRAPARFDATGFTIVQHFVRSADGTRVPYFLVSSPTDGSGGPAPTLLSGYGGFEVSNGPAYSGILGRSWLARGGRYALANIRGGGEYGPSWHRAGLRENRHRVYEDFEAVARDLVERGVTTPAELGIMGGSNGGLLVGNMYVRSPELFGAVVCQQPLLDMKRYSHLLAGASWVAEYGDPDNPADWEFIRTFSPYHLAEPGRPYPPLLLTTSTRDDRVHPGHARKMAARLKALGYDVTYWENIEGGHAGAADAPQRATMSALAYTFLHHHLFGSRPSPGRR